MLLTSYTVIHCAIFIHIHERKALKECFALIILSLMWAEQILKVHQHHLFNADTPGFSLVAHTSL